MKAGPSATNILNSAESGLGQPCRPALGRIDHPPLRADTTPYPYNSVDAVAFSPDGKLLTSADRDGTVRVWDPATSHPVGTPLRAAAICGRRHT
jgi:WD40 repeat protein